MDYAQFKEEEKKLLSTTIDMSSATGAEIKTDLSKEDDLDDVDDDEDDKDEFSLGFHEDGTLCCEAFSSGEHTDSKGEPGQWTDNDLEDIVTKGNSQLTTKPIPVVIGHPTDDAPAYGWVKSFKKVGSKIVAKLGDLHQGFVDSLKSNAYKSRSISLYGDNRVRHIGFLGAAQPAIEGLQPLHFSEDKNYKVYTFSEGEPDMDDVKSLKEENNFFKKLFNLFKIDITEAKKEFSEEKKPEVKVEDKKPETKDFGQSTSTIEKEQGTAGEKPVAPSAVNAEQVAVETKDPGPSATQKIAAAEAKNDATKAQAEADELRNKVAALEKQIAELMAAMQKEEASENESQFKEFCEGLVKEGRLRPVDVEIELESLKMRADVDKSEPKNFSEGQARKSRVSAYKESLKARPKVVEFGEASFPDALPPAPMAMSSMIDKKMKEKQEAQDKLGLTSKVSYWDMMKDCMAECAQEYPTEYAEYAKTFIPGMK